MSIYVAVSFKQDGEGDLVTQEQELLGPFADDVAANQAREDYRRKILHFESASRWDFRFVYLQSTPERALQVYELERDCGDHHPWHVIAGNRTLKVHHVHSFHASRAGVDQSLQPHQLQPGDRILVPLQNRTEWLTVSAVNRVRLVWGKDDN